MDARRASSAATRGAPGAASAPWGAEVGLAGNSEDTLRNPTNKGPSDRGAKVQHTPSKTTYLGLMTADERMARMTLHAIYPLYLAKIEKKGRSKAELDEILRWITQLDADGLARVQAEKWTFQELFDRVDLHPNAALITGVICGYRVENIENPVSQKVRYLDKIVDELAKGRAVEKIKRERLS
jgi:hypothetical protein